jgi:hypothetical protein
MNPHFHSKVSGAVEPQRTQVTKEVKTESPGFFGIWYLCFQSKHRILDIRFPPIYLTNGTNSSSDRHCPNTPVRNASPFPVPNHPKEGPGLRPLVRQGTCSNICHKKNSLSMFLRSNHRSSYPAPLSLYTSHLAFLSLSFRTFIAQ